MPWSCPKCQRSFGNRNQFHACDMKKPDGAMWQPPKGTKSAKPKAKPAGMTVMGWTCPRCGRTFKNASQAHSCLQRSVDDFYVGKPRARALHDSVVAFVRKNGGPFREHAQKTRVAFIATMSFAGIHAAGKEWVDFGFLLRRPLDEPRLRLYDALPGKWYGYRLRIADAKDLRPWLAPFVAEAYSIGSNEFYREGPAPTSK